MQDVLETLKNDIKKSHKKVKERYEIHFNIDSISLPGSEGSKFSVYINEEDKHMEYVPFVNIIHIRTDDALPRPRVHYLDDYTFMLEVPLKALKQKFDKRPLIHNYSDLLELYARKLDYLSKEQWYQYLAQQALLEEGLNMEIHKKEIYVDPFHLEDVRSEKDLYSRQARRSKTI